MLLFVSSECLTIHDTDPQSGLSFRSDMEIELTADLREHEATSLELCANLERLVGCDGWSIRRRRRGACDEGHREAKD
jgi:hypothetical protein